MKWIDVTEHCIVSEAIGCPEHMRMTIIHKSNENMQTDIFHESRRKDYKTTLENGKLVVLWNGRV